MKDSFEKISEEKLKMLQDKELHKQAVEKIARLREQNELGFFDNGLVDNTLMDSFLIDIYKAETVNMLFNDREEKLIEESRKQEEKIKEQELKEREEERKKMKKQNEKIKEEFKRKRANKKNDEA